LRLLVLYGILPRSIVADPTPHVPPCFAQPLSFLFELSRGLPRAVPSCFEKPLHILFVLSWLPLVRPLVLYTLYRSSLSCCGSSPRCALSVCRAYIFTLYSRGSSPLCALLFCIAYSLPFSIVAEPPLCALSFLIGSILPLFSVAFPHPSAPSSFV
jgi:hypothetical protein